VALFFKASAAPFHMWTPDVYEGAPTPITGLMSTGTKAAAFLLMLAAAPKLPREVLPVIPVVTIATILIGNLGALVQTNIKRLIAYSGIAHAGYLMVAFAALALGEGPQDSAYAIRAVLFYLVAYGVTNLAAIGVIALLERQDPGIVEIENLRGLSRRNPICAMLLALAMLSLAGIPPTVGFWGKYQVFSAALHTGLPSLTAVSVIGILLSVVSLFYYLRIIVYCWFMPAIDEQPIPSQGLGGRLALVLTGVSILALGLLPQLLLDTLVHVKL
jgi:NADH-quinone oxidoreductase subunit N